MTRQFASGTGSLETVSGMLDVDFQPLICLSLYNFSTTKIISKIFYMNSSTVAVSHDISVTVIVAVGFTVLYES